MSERRKPHWNDLAIWPAIVSAIFTAVLTIFTGISVFAFIQSERSILTVSDIAFDPDALKVGEPIRLVLLIKNSGKAAAQLTELKVIPVLDAMLPKTPSYPEFSGPGIQSFTLIAPGDTARIGVTTSSAINATGLANYQQDRARFFIHGYFTWKDGYSFLIGRNTLGFCYSFSQKHAANLGPYDTCDEEAYTFYR